MSILRSEKNIKMEQFYKLTCMREVDADQARRFFKKANLTTSDFLYLWQLASQDENYFLGTVAIELAVESATLFSDWVSLLSTLNCKGPYDC